MVRYTILIAFAALISAQTPAFSDASNLRCLNGFKKVKTFGSSIRCRAAKGGLGKKYAYHRAQIVARRAECNGHRNQPKTKVWRKNGKWAYRVTFICAVIF